MIVGVLFMAVPIICFVLAAVSLAVSAALMARAPLRAGGRAAAALGVLAIGFTPLALLILAAASWPAGD
jgi:hypothetical protein